MADPISSPPGRLVPLLLGTASLSVLAGAGLFWFASQQSQPQIAGAVAVTVSAAGCTPNALEVTAGKASFVISNTSDRPVEWEILDGVMVLAERENIAPGFSAELSERLKPGSYAITCGLLSNPRGTLTVRATAASTAETAAPPLREFLGPLSERKVQLMRAASKFAKATVALQAAIEAGDVAAAKSAWAEASTHWARLAIVAPRAADLQNRIAPQAIWLAEREADAGFTGLGRIEYGLFAQGTAAGLAPVAKALAADAGALQARLKGLDGTPDAIAGDAARYAHVLAEAEAGAGLAAYAGDDRAQIEAALESLSRAQALLAPLLIAANPKATHPVDAALAQAKAAVSTPVDRKALAAALAALAEAFGAINAQLGLEG